MKEERLQEYTIPRNYSGLIKIAGFRIRNLLEAAIFTGITFMIITKVPFVTNVKIFVTIGACGIVALFTAIGIKDESVTQFLYDYFVFLSRKKVYHMRRPDQYSGSKKEAADYESFYQKICQKLRKEKA